MNLIIGNIFGLFSSLLTVLTGLIKNKKKIICTQSIQISLHAISNILLGGLTGAIISIINLFRNFLCYKGKLRIKEKIIISVISISLSLLLNNLGFIGFLPLIGTTIYLWFMDVNDVIKFKLLIIFTMLTWLIYNLILKSYASSLFNLITAFTNIVSIITIKRKQNIEGLSTIN